MDLCESLNRAHIDQRKAERALRSGNLCEAIKNYTAAARNFDAAHSEFIGDYRRTLTVDSDIYAVETLISQRQFCLRQVELLAAKLEQLQRQWSALMEQQKRHGASSLSNLDYDRAMHEASAIGLGEHESRVDAFELRQRLLEKINEQDSLLGRLDTAEIGAPNVNDDAAKSDAIVKCPKSDKTIIEELRQCNEDLRQFILVLLNELESKTHEIERMKKELARPQSPAHRRRASTTPSKKSSHERGREPPVDESENEKLPDLPPLEFPRLKSLPGKEKL